MSYSLIHDRVWAKVFVIGLILAVASSCAKEVATEVGQVSRAGETFELKNVNLATPLSASEIESFVKIVESLPNKAVPDFGAFEIPSFQLDGDVETQVVKLRKFLRQSLEPQVLAAAWAENEALVQSFDQLQLDHTAFATLTLKVSLAWAAHRYSQNVVTQAAIDRADIQAVEIAQNLNRYRIAGWDTTQKCDSLLDVVVFSEFLKKVSSVDADSVSVVTLYSNRLAQAMPDEKWLNPLRSTQKNSKIQQVRGIQ